MPVSFHDSSEDPLSMGSNSNIRNTNTNTNTHMIRHSGRAHIRGKIRRVWRPRYLELCDSGLVHYYELPQNSSIEDGAYRSNLISTNSTSSHSHSNNNDSNDPPSTYQMIVQGEAAVKQQPHQQPHTQQLHNQQQQPHQQASTHPHHPKCTLCIYHTRMMDVTTFRDLHVGLPKGTYGFVFRGRRILADEEQHRSGNGDDDDDDDDDLVDQKACHPRIRQTPEQLDRDFLCAVATLEEAQSWVVALQWAATKQQQYQLQHPTNYTNNYHNTTNHKSWSIFRDDVDAVWSDNDGNDDNNDKQRSEDNDDDDAMSDFVSFMTPADSTTVRPRIRMPSSSSDRNAFQVITATTTACRPAPKKQQKQKQQKQSPGKIVVTKVRTYRLVRIKQRQFEVAYVIRLLLLRTTCSSSSSGSSSSSSSSNIQLVEERSVARTKEDIVHLLGQLKREWKVATASNDHGAPQEINTAATSSQQVLDNVERSLERLLPKSTAPATTPTPFSYTRILQSVPVVDDIFRMLAMDATICNSRSMRTFWGILADATNHRDVSSSPSSSLARTIQQQQQQQQGSPSSFPPSDQFPQRWIVLHHPSNILEKRSLTIDPKRYKSTDDFVKQWLSSGEDSNINSHTNKKKIDSNTAVVPRSSLSGRIEWYAVGILQLHPSFLTRTSAAVGGLVLCVPFLIRQYETYMVRCSSVRFDVLILSWGVTMWIGREWGKRSIPTTATRITAAATREKPIYPAKRARAGSHLSLQKLQDDEVSLLDGDSNSLVDCGHSTTTDEEDASSLMDESTDHDDDVTSSSIRQKSAALVQERKHRLSSPLPEYPSNGGESCWSKPDPSIFRVRGETYLTDKVKIPSGLQPFECLGVDVWLTDNPERHIVRHPSVLGGKLLGGAGACGGAGTFVVNFLLPFGNLVAYFSIPPLDKFPSSNLAQVWSRFIKGDQQYRDARLKLLPIVVDGPWIVKKAVGPGTSPALLGKAIPLQYYFSEPDDGQGKNQKGVGGGGVYEVDVIITASRLGKGILSVVKGHTNMLTIAFAFIIEAAEQEELPETVLCAFQMHSIHLEDCPRLPECNLDEIS